MRLLRTLSFLILLLAALGACDTPRPVVVLDGRENVVLCEYYRREDIATCTSEFGNFQKDILTQVALAPECKSVLFFRYNFPTEGSNKALGEAMRSSHWTLTLPYLFYSPGAQTQHWRLWRPEKRGPDLEGDDGPTDIAKKVCVIAKQQGGAIVN